MKRLSRRAARTLAATTIIGLGAALLTPADPAQAAGLIPTTTTLAASSHSVKVGAPVKLTATVGVSVAGVDLGGLAITPTGTVLFTEQQGTTTVGLGSAKLPSDCLLTLSTCTASITTSALPAGTDAVKATYAGDSLSATSSASTSIVVSPGAPGAPTDLVATGQVGEVQLTWDAPASDGGSAITSYSVYRGTAAGGEAATALATGLPSPIYTDTTTAVGTTYYYEVTATNAIGESGKSNEAHAVASALAAGSSTTVTCSTSCGNPTVSATDNNGLVTTLSLTSTSTQNQTITESVGGPILHGCSVPGAGFGATFNSTETSATKSASITWNGSEALAVYSEYNPEPAAIGCLGLGSEWTQHGAPVPYNATDGLYESSVLLCANDAAGIIYAGGTEPCLETNAGGTMVGGSGPDYITLKYDLPPGDGQIGGGR